MSTPTLYIHDLYQDDRPSFLLERLHGQWSIRTPTDFCDESQRIAYIEAADAVVSMSWDHRMPNATNLKLLQVPGAGYDQIEFSRLPASAHVCNVYEHEIGMAEYIVLGILEWEIRLHRLDAQLRAGDWSASGIQGAPLHGELFGKSVGFIGYGRIAKAAAARLNAFGVHIRACSRTPSASDSIIERVEPMTVLPSMLGDVDYVIVTCPLSEQTRGLMDADRFADMRADAVLINVARGPVVDEDALYAALSQRRIGGAIIDVWYNYPSREEGLCLPSRQPMNELPNLIMTPHVSGWSRGLLDRRFTVIADNLDRLRRGEPLRNVVRPAS